MKEPSRTSERREEGELSGLSIFFRLRRKKSSGKTTGIVREKNENAKIPDSKNSMSTQEKRGIS
jgi:hypothetical protein